MIEYRYDHIVDSTDRRKAWIDNTASLIETRIDPDVDVAPNVFQRIYNLKQILFAEFEAAPQAFERTRSRIAAQNIDHIALFLRGSGRSCFSAGGRSVEVGAESLVVMDLGQPVSGQDSGGPGLGVLVPQRLLETCGGNAAHWHGRVLPCDTSPIIRLLADHMRSSAACLRTATPAQKEQIAAATLSLCNAALLPENDNVYDGPAIGQIAVRQFIDRNLATVDAEMLMARFGLSRTPLYKLFEAEGGVYSYIRSRRLAHAMRQLGRAYGRRLTVKQLTFACGFENEQVFSRAFRRRYGLNPSEVAAIGPPPAGWDRSSRLMTWVKDL